MLYVPKIVYPGGSAGADVTLQLTLGQHPWRYSSQGVGGSDVSSVGIPEAFEIYRMRKAIVLPRFYEWEWYAVEAWLSWAQASGQAFTYWFNSTDNLSAYTCYLEAPELGEDIEPTREGFQSVFQLELTLRSTTGTIFDERAFDLGPSAPVGSVVVTPNPAVTDSATPVDFDADILDRNGVPLVGRVVVFSLDNILLGDIDASTGVFTPNLGAAGTGVVKAVCEGRVGVAPLTVT